MSQADATYWAYFDSTSISSYIQALDQLDTYLRAEGPFDAILAFSQGAGLAAMYLARKAIQGPGSTPPLKCAVLISCAAIYDPTAWLEHGQVRVLEPAKDGQLIKIPTVHIWGKEDSVRHESEVVSNLCDQSQATTFVHEGGHEVPRLGTKHAVAGTVKAMRRGITQALLLEKKNSLIFM